MGRTSHSSVVHALAMNSNRRKNLKLLPNWIIPLGYVAVSIIVGMIFPRIEHHFLPQLTSDMSPAAAMGVCGAIASGMIALTGIVFSLMFVMVQFSASAYSPRLVLWVARDPVMAHALGVFSATFMYALVMLGWVDRDNMGRVPLISEWMVILLLIASIGMFIALVERIGMLQVNRMLIFTGDQGRKAIEEIYSAAEALAAFSVAPDYRRLDVVQTILHAGRPQVIQAIRVMPLVKLAAASGAVIEMTAVVGDTVMESSPLMRVYGASRQVNEEALREAVELGDERTFEQDPKYAIRLVVDIAIKALSPAINDPTTAVQALDQIEDFLIRLGRSRLEIGAFRDSNGQLALVVPFPTWDDFLLLALDETRSYGADSVQVMRRMKALIENLTAVLPAERHAALRHWDQRLHGSITRSFADSEDKQDALVADRQGLGLRRDGVHPSRQ
jgi:uncharacterized membrane protein